MLVKQKVKYIQSLGQKKFRNQENTFIAEGPKLVMELLKSEKVNIREVFAVKEWLEMNTSLTKGIVAEEVTADELQRLSSLVTANQVLAVADQIKYEEWQPLPGIITLLLDDIRDPGNLGTIIRICDWFGIKNIVCSEHCAELYNPKVVQATMGSITRVDVTYADLNEIIDQAGFLPVYAAGFNGTPINKMQKIEEGLIIIGNEANGINAGILSKIAKTITIPGKGGAESLNAAVATGIILSHLT